MAAADAVRLTGTHLARSGRMRDSQAMIRITGLALIALALAVGCDVAERGEAVPDPVTRDIHAIREEGTLKVLMTFNSTSYFIYRGEPMGLEYELLQKFAKEKDLVLDVEVIRDASELWPRVNRGEADIAAARLLRRVADEKHVAYTRPIYVTKTAVVQRTGPPSEAGVPTPVDDLLELDQEKGANLEVRPVRSPEQLAGRRVHVPNRSPLEDVLVEVSDSVTGDVEIVQVRGTAAAEPLIRRVARGEISLTAAPEAVARLSGEKFENLEVQPTVGPQLNVVWAVRRNAPELRRELDEWIEQNQQTIEQLYEKYFLDRSGYRERVADEYLTSETGRLSSYDTIIRRHARDLGWDWRLLASQTYQESRFDPNARSWAGAVGLLQLMPGTAREVGVRNSRDPEQNVAGAVRYIRKLEQQWRDEIPDEEQRLRFVLASYNAGRGHVLDAQRLAEKNGDDPQKWDDVAYWMLQKSKRAVYTDPVVRHGYVRGLEPVTYVELILSRFDHYQEFVQTKEAEDPAA